METKFNIRYNVAWVLILLQLRSRPKTSVEIEKEINRQLCNECLSNIRQKLNELIYKKYVIKIPSLEKNIKYEITDKGRYYVNQNIVLFQIILVNYNKT